jgi:hypothetical protein
MSSISETMSICALVNEAFIIYELALMIVMKIKAGSLPIDYKSVRLYRMSISQFYSAVLSFHAHRIAHF